MIREREKTIETLIGFGDICLTITSLLIAYVISKSSNLYSLLQNREYIVIILMIIPTWYVLLNLSNQNKIHRVKTVSLLFIDYLIVITSGLGIIFLAVFAFKLESISRIVIFSFGLINFIVLFSLKILTLYLFKRYREKGYNSKNLMIIADESSEDLIQALIDNTFWGYIIKVIITDSEPITNKYIHQHTVLPNNTNIDKFIELETIDEIIYCKKDIVPDEVRKLVYSCQEIGVVFRLKSQIYSMIASKSYMSYLDETPFFTFSKTPTDYFGLKIKVLFDFLFAFVVLLLFLPFFILIGIIIKLTSKGPVLFKQTRVGLRGRKFGVYKFRTMRADAPKQRFELNSQNEMDGPVFKIKNDPRITKIGAFLRKTSLDEIPQFINVLKGEMSVVGPRPLPDYEVAQFSERWQLRRHSMKPGITCIWQVSGRNNISFDDWMKLDLQYIDSWSIKLDLIIILKTVRTIVKADGF